MATARDNKPAEGAPTVSVSVEMPDETLNLEKLETISVTTGTWRQVWTVSTAIEDNTEFRK